MNIYVWEYSPFQFVTTTADDNGSNYTYFYWVCFTPNKNCSITKVKFLLWDNPYVWKLRIGVWSNAQSMSSAETYDITATDNPDWIYTLSTPYSLTANTNYCVAFRNTSWYTVWINKSMSWVYPVVCDDITYNYGTYSYTTTHMTWYAYCISWLEITTS